MITTARSEGNDWLRQHCSTIEGRVLSIGSLSDKDKQNGFYRDYFPRASSYQTSDMCKGADLILDVRNMPGVESGWYDAVFCWSVMEHVDRVSDALSEIHRVMCSGGLLILGTPFAYPVHREPRDYWRWTEYGLRLLLNENFVIENLMGFGGKEKLPDYYGVIARKKRT